MSLLVTAKPKVREDEGKIVIETKKKMQNQKVK